MHDAYASDDEDDPLRRTPKMENDGNATILRAPNSYNQFTEKETAVIMERYIENYEAYHNKQLGKIGESEKKKFLASLTEEVNSIGVSVRTEKQIDQKIRDEMKTVKKYATAVKQEQLRTGGGCAVLSRITRVQKYVFEALEKRPRLAGMQGGHEIGSNPDLWTQKRKGFDDEAPKLEEQVQSMKPPKIMKKEDSSKSERELREQLIEAELKNAQLRRENLLMEQQVLEAKLAYWNEKRRSYFAGTAV